MDVNDEDDFVFAFLLVFAALIKSLRCKELKEVKKSPGKDAKGGQGPCGFVHGYRKLEGSSKGTLMHFLPGNSATKISTPFRII
ncbi:hypothetical protein DPMN_073301 [Dreissena polymorpha]|uniref:Uncharacterized protein n=1 Tax=Dreissena polymorpha TaxID=45954 RepID=A0A9D4BYX9_DREPO|nr:hypothetical protein DPMN_073301 [Dreissena polymorpha]